MEGRPIGNEPAKMWPNMSCSGTWLEWMKKLEQNFGKDNRNLKIWDENQNGEWGKGISLYECKSGITQRFRHWESVLTLSSRNVTITSDESSTNVSWHTARQVALLSDVVGMFLFLFLAHSLYSLQMGKFFGLVTILVFLEQHVDDANSTGSESNTGKREASGSVWMPTGFRA